MTTVPERLARVEATLEHMLKTQASDSAKLDAVIEAVTIAKGGWKVAAIFGSVAGGMVSWAATHLGIPRVA